MWWWVQTGVRSNGRGGLAVGAAQAVPTSHLVAPLYVQEDMVEHRAADRQGVVGAQPSHRALVNVQPIRAVTDARPDCVPQGCLLLLVRTSSLHSREEDSHRLRRRGTRRRERHQRRRELGGNWVVQARQVVARRGSLTLQRTRSIVVRRARRWPRGAGPRPLGKPQPPDTPSDSGRLRPAKGGHGAPRAAAVGRPRQAIRLWGCVHCSRSYYSFAWRVKSERGYWEALYGAEWVVRGISFAPAIVCVRLLCDRAVAAAPLTRDSTVRECSARCSTRVRIGQPAREYRHVQKQQCKPSV